MSSLALNIALVAIITISSVVCFPQLNDPVVVKCDNSHCTEPKADKLNVHLIPHTHDDVGWLKTVDQYYWGSYNRFKSGVQYILDSVIESLLQNDKRKFIYVETAFFWMWWTKQDQKTRDDVKTLVNNGMNYYF